MKPGQHLSRIREQYSVEELRQELEWLHKRINEVFLVSDIKLDRTLTPAGTTLPQTINKIAGSFNLAAGESSKTITNSFVDANSLVLCVIQTNDTTAITKNAVPAAGSFTYRTTAAVTAETRIGFLVIN